MLNHYQHIKNIEQRKPKGTKVEASEKSWLDYAIDALTPVADEIVEVQQKLAQEMISDLEKALSVKEIIADFSLIGGIASKTHIKHEDKIDLLILFKGYCYDQHTKNETNLPLLEDIILLRDYTKRFLRNKFPEALLDDSQPLALEMSILSLPCNFCYYFGYQQLNQGLASGNFSPPTQCKLLNFKSFTFENIDPLIQIIELNNKDSITKGNVKTLIRILKNLKSDAFEPVTLTGHQLTSIIYSMDDYTLSKPPGQLLFLLLEVSLFLKRLIENPFIRKSLKNADHTILIDDGHEESFVHGIKELKIELDSLIKQLVLEIDLYSNIYDLVSI